ncbi:MalY/PatB family protein [Mesoterricola sediminis]|uniref:cysteine-S-conjugate beta-lyase n=1 Tax=Mesoterricola sediminis TaxID=2927980 RepID=A0AA48GSI8_9BACT|nr:PatB family C-S lyase [Mesoterricola sediminis]BDU76854.1 aminotransferase class I/II [Mesoterricola sediminis]
MYTPFPPPETRRATDSLKWKAYAGDVIPLWVADMDFAAPEPVLDALRTRLDHGILGYTDLAGAPETGAADLREVIVARLARRYGWEVAPEALVFVPGVVTGLNLACHALGGPGDEAVVQPPVYTPFLHAPGTAGMARRDAPLARDGDGTWRMDLDAFEAALGPRTRAWLLCNPHNPVGRAWRRDELEAAAERCLRAGVPMVSDEIHCDLLFEGRTHVPLASLGPEVARRTITLMAPSKTFNIAGLTCSFAVIPDPDLRRAYLQARRGLVPWVNLLGVVAAEAAYRHGQPWLDTVMAELEANRAALAAAMGRDLPGLAMAAPEATYLAWIDCRGAGLGEDPAGFFQARAKVALIGGETFGDEGRGHVRLNFGCRGELLQEALARMGAALRAR